MIEKKYREEIFEVFEQYGKLRQDLSDLEKLTEMLSEQQELIHQLLVDNRNKEKDLINKIEKETGKTITSQQLLEIIQSYEK